MDKMYYRSKVLSLMDKIFIQTGDARSRLISCEDKLSAVVDAALSNDVPENICKSWQEIWDELNTKEDLYIGNALVKSSFYLTVMGKRNKSMEKYLHFIIEEFYRVVCNY